MKPQNRVKAGILLIVAILIGGAVLAYNYYKQPENAQLSIANLPVQSQQMDAAPDTALEEKQDLNKTSSTLEKEITGTTPAAIPSPAVATETAALKIELTIRGDGVSQVKQYSRADLQAMQAGYKELIYSMVNNVPMQKFFVGKGVRLNYLLEQAGIKSDARSIVVKASDGYKQKFTLLQIKEPRYYYPGLMSNSSAGAVEVPAILAWEHLEGSNDLTQALPSSLRLLVGQKSPDDINAPQMVKYVNEIEVVTENIYSLPNP